MPSRDALVFGEALIDVYPDNRVVAGAPLHVAAHLAERGWHTRFVTRLGADPDGDRIRSSLERQGVDLSLVETDVGLPTGEVTITFDGPEHSFTIHRPAAWDAIEGPQKLPAHDVFCYGSLAGRDARSREALRRLLDLSGAPLKAFDVNLRPPDVLPEVLMMGLRRATLLKLSGEEFDEVARLLGMAAEPGAYFDAAPELRWLCVTLGADGARLVRRAGGELSIGGPDVDVVDAVGAGDVFTAGLVGALAGGASDEEALESARDAAGVVLVQQGGLPRPPDPTRNRLP
ncbi:MAG: PfkB family carbohydrate kinase [Actinomycetota bacterium]|nr:PfkB family carbohydrate kinase [Actinomycetota bacterium]